MRYCCVSNGAALSRQINRDKVRKAVFVQTVQLHIDTGLLHDY